MPTELKFLDSNIWLYALVKEQDADKHSIARELVQQPGIAVSTQIINEVCFNLYRNKIQTETELEKLIQGFYRKHSVVTLDYHVLTKASLLRQSYKLSFWDSLIVSAALQAQAAILYSEDMQHNQLIENCLTIINPFET
jgi:predicted nucleic acid-binding protein